MVFESISSLTILHNPLEISRIEMPQVIMIRSNTFQYTGYNQSTKLRYSGTLPLKHSRSLDNLPGIQELREMSLLSHLLHLMKIGTEKI